MFHFYRLQILILALPFPAEKERWQIIDENSRFVLNV